ncbi:MAG: hypothetical protein ACTSRW_12215 [Candidatus Helarchaeota archaeon]
MERRKKNSFSVSLHRLQARKAIIKIKRGEYFIDREEILEDVKQLANRHGVNLSIITYDELPKSLKLILERSTTISGREVIDSNLKKEQEQLKKEVKRYENKFRTLKQTIKIFNDIYLKIAEATTIDTVHAELGRIEGYVDIIDNALKIIEEET